jgi:toxin ParE1/3/4
MARAARKPAAEVDLLDNFVYLGLRDVRVAQRFLQSTEAAIAMLADAPQLGSSRRSRNPRLADIRTWVLREFRKYVIYYRPTAEGIEVIRVLHGSRRPDRLLLEALQ